MFHKSFFCKQLKCYTSSWVIVITYILYFVISRNICAIKFATWHESISNYDISDLNRADLCKNVLFFLSKIKLLSLFFRNSRQELSWKNVLQILAKQLKHTYDAKFIFSHASANQMYSLFLKDFAESLNASLTSLETGRTFIQKKPF